MKPKPLGDARDHYWKVTDMAGAIGVPLVDLWHAGELSSAGYAAMIERCRRCADPEACAKLIARRPDLSAPPSYCENNGSFTDLSRKARAFQSPNQDRGSTDHNRQHGKA